MPSPLSLCLLLALLLQTVAAVKFDLPAGDSNQGNEHCVSQYIAKNMLCTANLVVGGFKQSGQVDVRVFDTSSSSNEYQIKVDVTGSTKFSFTTHEWADVKFCFMSKLAPGARPSPDIFREINLHVDTGAEAADYSEIKRKEKLSDLEVELLRLENIVKDLMSELEYLHKAEFEMRDTNEDTNERVKWFSVFSMVLLIGVGLWQIWYLQKFFQSKKLI